MIKRLIALIIIFMGLYYIYDNNLFGYQQFVRDIKKEIYLPDNNSYVKEELPISFVKMTNDFVPDSKQELLNIYYTAVNSGWDEFIFYCNYDNCMKDVSDLSTDTLLLSNLNSFVSPYNQYSTISTYRTPLFNQKVHLFINRTYDEYVIGKLNTRIDEIYNELNIKDKPIRDQIRAIHDYIINNTKYDALKIDNINDNTYHSSTAYGTIFEGYAVCSGYADAMSIFLDKLGVPNYRVASEAHVWNYVYVDNKWWHLDLTWDDPYSEKGTDVINHYFFLIDYKTLKQWGTTEHIFDTNIYKEATS